MFRSDAAAEAWTQRVGGYARLPSLLLDLGLDPISLIGEAGLDGDALVLSDGRIPYAGLGRLLRISADRSGCAHFGLLAGQMWRLPDLGAVGVLARNSATVGDALQVLTGYQHLDSQGGIAYVTERDGTADIGYAIYHPDVSGTDQIFDSILAQTFNYMRELCGPDWIPSDVLVPHARPFKVRPYRDFFRVNPRFNCEVCTLRFPACQLNKSIVDVDPRQRRLAEDSLDPMHLSDPVQQVFRALRRLLLDGQASGNDVAQALAMHRRTLNRRLKSHGTTYQNVLDKIRFSVARQLLATSELPLDDVAANLGYSSVTPFMRTFNRWAGASPGRWRRAAAGVERSRAFSHSLDP